MPRALTEDERCMRRALALARRAEGETNPNPMVGCVIVRAGRIVGEGYHRRAGEPHAEVVALSRAGRHARGGTLYVTLEPCAHHGRTPPCAPLVATAGLRRVVVAVSDPDARVRGRGLALLRRAGLDVTAGVLADEARELNRRFIVPARCARPFILLKAAVTLDGRIATATGDSRWITRPAQRAHARGLRRLHDGVLVGIGTVLADDPRLLPSPRLARPFQRIVLDSHLRLPLQSRLVRSARQVPVVVVALDREPRRRRALEAAGVTVLCDRRSRRQVDVRRALDLLWTHGLRSVMVEGGSAVLGAFLAARLLDELVLYRAPLLLGGRDSLPAFGGPNPARIVDALRLRRVPGASAPGADCERWCPASSRAW